jgi:hypothetical protein
MGDGLSRFRRTALRQIFRMPGARGFASKMPVGSIETRVWLGLGAKPMYTFGVYSAASLAKTLGIPGISVIEFGVAGGRGLMALENAAEEVEKHFGVAIDVFGFDTGEGMPAPTDYRDIPYAWGQGFYKMDVERLQSKLKRAHLMLGDVGETVAAFVPKIKHPIGFVSFDLDYYSSTRNAFRLWEGSPETRLPRVMCYFDDVFCYNEYVGELCAIREFNLEQSDLKISPMHMLRHTQQHPSAWHDQIYMLHDFRHPLYAVNVRQNAASNQLPL